MDWSKAGSEDDFTGFIGELTRLRRDFPQLRPRRWLDGQKADGSYDVKWLTPQATEMTEADWNLPHARFLAYVLAAAVEGGKPLFVVLNRTDAPVEITFPEWPGVTSWHCVLDTSDGQRARGDAAARRQLGRACPLRAGVCGRAVSAPSRFGPLLSDRGVTFRLWAPGARAADLLLDQPATDSLPMSKHGEWFETHAPDAGPGTRYRFRIDGELDIPDPVSHFQPEDVQGPSEVIDHSAYQWQAPDWKGLPWERAVFIETHVGTFTRAGTFRAMIERLDHLAETGITALELMPVADFPGRWNWGYDGVLLFAPDASYGQPDDLKALIDAAHTRGIMVFLDVVYNHFGPEGNYLHRIAPAFFSDEHQRPGVSAIDYRVDEVREFAIENALHWLRDYRFDGLRLDAVHAIPMAGAPHILIELAKAVNAFAAQSGRHIHLVLENDDNAARFLAPKPKVVGGFYRAQWNDDYHHAWHVLLTGERAGYYRDYQNAGDHIARTLAQGFAYQGEPSAFRGGKKRGEAEQAAAARGFRQLRAEPRSDRQPPHGRTA